MPQSMLVMQLGEPRNGPQGNLKISLVVTESLLLIWVLVSTSLKNKSQEVISGPRVSTKSDAN